MSKLYSLFAVLLLVSSMASAQNDPLWLRYPAISPDGNTIAFNYKGNIYKVDAKGGVAYPLSANPAYDFQAVWSPDSKSIAFASDRHGNFDVFTIPATGGVAQRLTYHSTSELPSTFTPDGKQVVFSAQIQDKASNVMFPSGVLPELYQVPVSGGRTQQIITTPAVSATFNKDGSKIFYEDRKGYENIWRKHHNSSIARDIWVYDTKTAKHTKLTTSTAEDRNPILSKDGKTIYYLSEQTKSTFNVHKLQLSNPGAVTPVSSFTKHPVRFLSKSADDVLCYSYNGEIYTQKDGEQPKKVEVKIFADASYNAEQFKKLRSGASEMAVSPDGKEVVIVVRGEVYVSSVKYGTTKRITNTPEQERSVSFSPDGNSILFASERNNSWNLYQVTRTRDEEKSFAYATLLKEEALYENLKEECFQPSYSPDGKEVAFLSNRTALKVINLKSKKVRTILDGTQSYSYTDGDQWYEWSPDSKWFVVQHAPTHFVRDNLGIVAADGKSALRTILITGYNDRNPHWGMDGKMIYWFTDRQGLRSHGSWGSQYDVYGVFLTQDAYDEYRLNEEDYLLAKDNKKDAKKDDKKKDDKKKDKKDKKGDKSSVKPIRIEWNQLEDRMTKLTLHSSSLSDAILSKKGDKLYYLSRFEKGFDLWESDLRKKSTKKLLKLSGGGGAMQMDKDGKNLFLISGGQLMKVALAGAKRSGIRYTAEFDLNKQGEYSYFFEHAWRQVREKWYHPDLHGVDWDFYKKEYSRFIPHINNNYDFAEMLSEILGELNGSHTGSGYRHRDPNGDVTASLGVFYDWSYKGKGVKIAEVIDKSPLKKAKSKAKAGTIIEKIDGVEIKANDDFYRFMNHKRGKRVLVSFNHNGTRWDEVVKPISGGFESELLYQRWVKKCAAAVEKVSNGRVGYTHVRGMNGPSFRKVYSDVLGKNINKEALIVDTRFNGGGWLHDDLATLLTGEVYVTYWPRNSNGKLKKVGHDPLGKWSKPSCVLMSESNYSDAHAFPYTYKALNIGKLVGMPVPGTMTAVWWESFPDRSMYFGIPQVGAKDKKGNYLENQQLEPDVKQALEYEKVIKGEDQQIQKAVESLLSGLKK